MLLIGDFVKVDEVLKDTPHKHWSGAALPDEIFLRVRTHHRLERMEILRGKVREFVGRFPNELAMSNKCDALRIMVKVNDNDSKESYMILHDWLEETGWFLDLTVGFVGERPVYGTQQVGVRHRDGGGVGVTGPAVTGYTPSSCKIILSFGDLHGSN